MMSLGFTSAAVAATLSMSMVPVVGSTAAARTLAAQLADALRDKFLSMGATTMPLDEVRRLAQQDTGVEVGLGEMRDALANLEREGVVRMLRANTVAVLG